MSNLSTHSNHSGLSSASINSAETEKQRAERHTQERDKRYEVSQQFYKDRETLPKLERFVFSRFFEALKEGMHPDFTASKMLSELELRVTTASRDAEETSESSAAVMKEVRHERKRFADIEDPDLRISIKEVDEQIKRSLFVHYTAAKYAVMLTDSEFNEATRPDITLRKLKRIFTEARRAPADRESRFSESDDIFQTRAVG